MNYLKAFCLFTHKWKKSAVFFCLSPILLLWHVFNLSIDAFFVCLFVFC